MKQPLKRWRRCPRNDRCQILGDMDEERAADILEWMCLMKRPSVGDLPEKKAKSCSA